MLQELYLFGPDTETAPFAGKLEASGFRVQRLEHPFFTDEVITLFYNGRTYAGHESVDRLVVRLSRPSGEEACRTTPLRVRAIG